MRIKWSDNITIFDTEDKGDVVILTILAILFGPSLISILGGNIIGAGGATSYVDPSPNPNYNPNYLDNNRPNPTIIAPKPTPDILFDMDRDTKAILYKKGDCSIFIKDPKNIIRSDAEIGNCTGSNWEDVKARLPTVVPTIVPTEVPAISPTSNSNPEIDSMLARIDQKLRPYISSVNIVDRPTLDSICGSFLFGEVEGCEISSVDGYRKLVNANIYLLDNYDGKCFSLEFAFYHEVGHIDYIYRYGTRSTEYYADNFAYQYTSERRTC